MMNITKWHIDKGGSSMAKAIRIFQFTLNPDVRAEEFERFVAEQLSKAPLGAGVRIRFFRCDRDSQGDLIGTYANVLEFDSVEVRDRDFPTVSETSAEFDEWWAEHGTLWGKFHSMVDGRYIDYIEYEKWEGMA
jgi:hypothetical protein